MNTLYPDYFINILISPALEVRLTNLCVAHRALLNLLSLPCHSYSDSMPCYYGIIFCTL